MRTLIYDLRFSLRQLRKTQGMTILAVLTLALGIGANTAIFTVIEDVILRPLPYRDADRLVFIGPKTGNPGFNTTSWMNFRDIHEQSRVLENTAGYSEDLSVLETPDGSQSIAAPRVSTNLFSSLMLGLFSVAPSATQKASSAAPTWFFCRNIDGKQRSTPTPALSANRPRLAADCGPSWA
jgi:hypothetical protein